MEKLKTLKDIDFEIVGNDGCSYDFGTGLETLKEEAIKYVRMYEEIELPSAIPENTRDYGKGLVVDFIKHFFNVAYNDLE